jgi:hypothetical protein
MKGGNMANISVFCPTKKKTKEIVVQIPAWEVCPICENPFGIGHKKCFFTVITISEDIPCEIANLAAKK